MSYAILKAIFGIITWGIVLPFATPFLLFFSVWKCVVLLYVKIRNINKIIPIEPTNFADTVFSLSDFATFITTALTCSDIIDLDKLRQHFHNTFLKDGKEREFSIFHYTFTTMLGYPYKIAVPLDLNKHIREEELDPRVETEDEAFMRITQDHSNIRGHFPKWEIVLLHNRREKRSSLLFKISHGLADGTSTRSLVDKLTNTQPIYRKPEGSTHKGIWHQVKLFAMTPILMLQLAWLLKQSNFGAHPFPHLNEAVKKRECKNKNAQIPWSRGTLELAKVKEISKKTGIKITSILYSLYVTSLKRTLKELGKWEEDRISKETLAVFPLPGPNHPAEYGQFCTHFVQGLANLPLKKSDKLEQLVTIHKRLENYERGEIGLAILQLQQTIGTLLPKSIIISSNKAADEDGFFNCVNPFVFSPLECDIIGAPVTGLFGLCCAEEPVKRNTLLFCPFTTLGSKINLSIHGCVGILETQKEVNYFMDVFLDEVTLLGKEVTNLRDGVLLSQ